MFWTVYCSLHSFIRQFSVHLSQSLHKDAALLKYSSKVAYRGPHVSIKPGSYVDVYSDCSSFETDDKALSFSPVIPLLKDTWYLVVHLVTCMPMAQGLMRDPVIAADGHSYERTALEAWLAHHHTSPVTSLPLPHKRIVDNVLVKNAISQHEQEAL